MRLIPFSTDPFNCNHDIVAMSLYQSLHQGQLQCFLLTLLNENSIEFQVYSITEESPMQVGNNY